MVADGWLLLRNLLTVSLNRHSARYEVVAAVETAPEAIAACATQQPDLLILDLELQEKSGLRVVPALRQAAPGTRLLLCTAHPTASQLLEAWRSGAGGFVEKTNTWDEFQEAVDRVGRGEQYFSSHRGRTPSGLASPALLGQDRTAPQAMQAEMAPTASQSDSRAAWSVDNGR